MITKSEYLRRIKTAMDNDLLPAVSEMGNCRYRTDDGKKCLVGLLIPDDKYDKSMEGATCITSEIYPVYERVEGLNDEAPGEPGSMSQNDYFKIQGVHDSYSLNWNKEAFWKELLDLPCFSDVKGEYEPATVG